MNNAGINFFDAHTYDWCVLIGLALFPRITMLFVGGPFSILQWVGWALAPHFTVALMATFMYWDTNPVLVGVSWLFAFAGSGGEVKVSSRVSRRARNGFRSNR